MTTKAAPDAKAIAAGLSDDERQAIMHGHVAECWYNHPNGTRCPCCNDWPFAKGGAAEFLETMRAHLTQEQPR